MKTIGRKHFHFLFPAGMDGATGGVIPLLHCHHPIMQNPIAQSLPKILPQILGFLLGGGLKSKSSTYIEKIFPCEFLRKKLIIQVYFSYLIAYLLVYTH